MIDKGYIKTRDNKGKHSITIFPSDKDHWTTPYLNAFHLLNPTKQPNTTLQNQQKP
ncbi:hypothetical protein Klosneuvirus_1_415 [Klosneuvirus KNV1]|uniref:Uncharacterized protein n=1 Tax=Klosneuvirus KNV1 TaxID=1977640 RepID=A0A1V0SIU6_9VIRU|nr:hypothetical protein Klosneuvirus_1_415 [Klosneuvirus KNV1]